MDCGIKLLLQGHGTCDRESRMRGGSSSWASHRVRRDWWRRRLGWAGGCGMGG